MADRHFKTYDELSFSGDFMFFKIMTDEALCKTVIRDIFKVDVDRIEYLGKQQEINMEFMTLSMKYHEFFEIGKEEGMRNGILEKTVEVAVNFLRMGLDPEQIAQGRAQVFRSKKWWRLSGNWSPGRDQQPRLFEVFG